MSRRNLGVLGLFRPLLRPVIILAALVLLFEEWLWERLSALLGRLVEVLRLQALERWLSCLQPGWALAFMAVPSLLLFPAKLAGLALLGQGRVMAAMCLLVAAKLVGTAVVARLFKVLRPSLLKLAWFAVVYAHVTRWLAQAHAWFDALPAVQQTRARVAAWKNRLKQARPGLISRAISLFKRILSKS